MFGRPETQTNFEINKSVYKWLGTTMLLVRGIIEQVGRWHFEQQIKETVETKLLDGLTYTYCEIFQQPLVSLELIL